MSKKRKAKQNPQFQHKPFPTLPYSGDSENAKITVSEIIGMFSIKTIRTRTGKIVVRKGQQISESIVQADEIDEVYYELLANAMPGRKS
jgi:hypothetical protein